MLGQNDLPCFQDKEQTVKKLKERFFPTHKMMSEAEALDVITRNPGILACNPAGLKQAKAGDVKRAAVVVDLVEALPLGARWAAELLRYETPEVQRFAELYEQADARPEVLAEASLSIP